jgi:drug/metabolite transporter (DMT)-like permease
MNYYLYLAFLITFIWGLSPVIIKYAIHHGNIPTYLIIFIESSIYFIASLAYVLIFKYKHIKDDIIKYKTYIPLLAFIALFSLYVANLLYVLALQNNVNINILTIIVGLYPVITIIFSYIILKEKITMKAIFGYLCIVLGIFFILY